MSDEDRYRHHAYNYGWQRAVLHRMDQREPMDPAGDWFIANMAERAEDWHRKRLHMVPRRKPITPAERERASEVRDELMRRLMADSPRAAAMLETAMRPAIPGKVLSPAEINAELGIAPAPEIAPP